jgi:hypothetical protein
LITLNSSESKESIDTNIVLFGQVWDELWPLAHGLEKRLEKCNPTSLALPENRHVEIIN